jgi:excisionase family DNA binding protein
MAAIYLNEAAKLVGVNPSTLHRAMKKGKLSFTLDGDGQRVIDPAELDRWHSDYQARFNGSNRSKPDAGNPEQRIEIVQLQAQLEVERAKGAGLLEKLADIKAQLGDMRAQRDEWKMQAQTLLLGDQRGQPPKARKWWQFGKRESA